MTKEALAAGAKKLGFDICRVAKCGAPPHAGEFEAWLGQGRAGEMAWMERNKERRVNPQLVLPGAKSIIVLGMNYFQGPNDAAPRIARYAWGDDYHGIIEEKLDALDEFLRGHGGLQKCYVDTGPVLERDFAAVAGAGWHGKSTMLINRNLGTWFFLAEILTTLDLEADAPERDHCGSCTRCIDACPTAAITAPYQLDARRCISYLTIELKGSIPGELRPLIGDRIYGCDDCLAACPWNRFARQAGETAFAMRDAVAQMRLRDFLELTDEQFRTLFRKSPIKRIKRRGFLRNVCVALGNVGTPEDLPALEKAALDLEPLICEHARWAVERIRERPMTTPVLQ
ncbi:MAG TPA: tRNA epoxyqueuosine(34) reductase QueG [Chthoniobacteraceae bacterium]|nr:tRNA epoxyqueuosine(34) reductase QueG [Chthoniobacteraceae bacterium]